MPRFVLKNLNQMRRIKTLPIIVLAVLATSCADRLRDSGNLEPQGVGEILLLLNADDGTVTKADDAGGGISVDAFSVEIFNSSSIRLYNRKFGQAKEEVIPLNSGEYRLLAKYGDSLGVGFDRPFFLADQPFQVRPQTRETVEAVARLANVKVAVEFGDNLKAAYPDFYAVVRHTSANVKSSLKFLRNETRRGYIPGGDLVVELYADPEGNGKWKYYAAPVQTCSPNDFVTFRIDTGANFGDLVINVLVDTSTDQIEKTIEIPGEAASAPAPSIEAVGFTGDRFPVKSGDVSEHLAYFSIMAPGTIASCSLEINSPYLASIGVPQTVDLLSNNAADALAPAGIWFGGDLQAMAVDLSGLAPVLANTGIDLGLDLQLASLTLDVVDGNGRTDSFTVAYDLLPEGVVSIEPGMIWARRIAGASAELTSSAGDPSKLSLQYSADGFQWSEIPASVSGRVLSVQELAGLEPATEYTFRLLYDGLYTLDSRTVTTETAAQVGNAGFEQWTVTPWHTTSLYEPFPDADSQWWDVNSKVSMPDNSYSSYACFKCMPTVTYSSNTVHSGSAAAQITTINVGSINSTWWTNGTWYVGELFIGDADSNGSKVRDGHSFSSRPSALTFWYHYTTPVSDAERFGVEVSVRDAGGAVIAGASFSEGQMTSGWTKMTLPLNYSVSNVKAASISISFRSSSNDNHSCNAGGNWIEIAGETGSGDSMRVKLSATLFVDDVELVY